MYAFSWRSFWMYVSTCEKGFKKVTCYFCVFLFSASVLLKTDWNYRCENNSRQHPAVKRWSWHLRVMLPYADKCCPCFLQHKTNDSLLLYKESSLSFWFCKLWDKILLLSCGFWQLQRSLFCIFLGQCRYIVYLHDFIAK